MAIAASYHRLTGETISLTKSAKGSSISCSTDIERTGQCLDRARSAASGTRDGWHEALYMHAYLQYAYIGVPPNRAACKRL